MVIKSTAFLQPGKLTAGVHTPSSMHASVRSYVELVCISLRGTATIQLQGNIRSEHLLLMWFTVSGRTYWGEKDKVIFWKKDVVEGQTLLSLCSLPLLAPSLAVQLPLYRQGV